jgi:hypothetical protein
MKNELFYKWWFLRKIILVLVVILGVTGICGCNNSVSNSTKHFDNGFAFDYPTIW